MTRGKDKSQGGPAAQAGATRYAYKASLVGVARQFELTEQGLSWRLGRRSGVWPYSEISAIRLSYRPVWLQAHRFRADIRHYGGARLSMLSTSWQTAALMKPQDQDYRAFITKLHARLAMAGTKARFEGGLGRKVYAAALVLLAFIGFAIAGLVVRALVTGQFAGALFLTAFAALFAWQVGGFVRRNRPLAYDLEHLPQALLP